MNGVVVSLELMVRQEVNVAKEDEGGQRLQLEAARVKRDLVTMVCW